MNKYLLPGRSPGLPVIFAVALSTAVLSALLSLAIFSEITSSWFIGWFAASAGSLMAHVMQKKAIGNSFNQFLALSMTGTMIRASFIISVVVAGWIMKVSDFATLVVISLAAHTFYMVAEVWFLATYTPEKVESIS